jgi:thioredoxin-like negative regulator of GroEL
MALLVDVLRKQGKFGEAEGLLRQILAARRKASPGGQPEIATALVDLATVLLDDARAPEAEPLLDEALSLSRHDRPGDPERIGVIEQLRARCRAEKGESVGTTSPEASDGKTGDAPSR